MLRGLGLCRLRVETAVLAGVLGLSLTAAGHAQQERHGRKYKPLPPTTVVTVSVEKAFNSKPLANAAVVFQAERDGKKGSMELKTDPDGKASIDIIEVGSHIRLQVFAPGYASYATEFDVTSADEKSLLVKLVRPRGQVSAYGDDSNKPSDVQPGIQVKKPEAGPQPAGPPPTGTGTPPAGTTQGPPLV